MPKARFSSFDVRAMVLALRTQLVGFRVANVYDIDAKTYLLKLAKPDGKATLLIQSGIRIHTTEFARDKSAVPSGFTLKLRKHLRQKRVERIEQLGSDRVVVITCGSGDYESHLVVELYDKGNIILTDQSHSILTLLRNSKFDADSRLTVGQEYTLTSRLEAGAISRDALADAMRSAEGTQTAMKLMMRLLPLGKEMGEHSLLTAGLPLNTKMSTQPWEDEAMLERLEAAIADANVLLASVEEQPGGIIILKEPKKEGKEAASSAPVPAAADDAPAAEDVYEEFAPFELSQHTGKRLVRFGSFSEAADDFFSKIEVQRAAAEYAAQQGAAWKKVDKIRAGIVNHRAPPICDAPSSCHAPSRLLCCEYPKDRSFESL